MTLDSLLTFLENHQTLTYVILFLGSFLETLIGVSFLVYGEIFFLAGAILAGLGELNLGLVMLALYSGGIIGDHTSYWIGRFYGDSFYRYLQNKPFFKRFFNVDNYNRGTNFFKRFGGWSVFVGRFLGPVSWITPFLAGVFRLSYLRFTLFDIPAVVLGIGQFIIVGYFFGKSYQEILTITGQYMFIILFVGSCLLVVWYYYRRLLRRLDMTIRHSLLHFFSELRKGNRALIKRTFWTLSASAVVVVILYTVTLLIIFFVENQRLNGIIEPDLQNTFAATEEVISSIDSTTYYKDGTKDVGPINVLIITNKPLAEIMPAAGWIRGKTFIRDKVSFSNYFEQMEDNVFPISDLYFKGVPQNYAYQYVSSTLSVREHIRVWSYGTLQGTPIYAVSVSKDFGFDFYRNLSFLIPFHAVDPAVDASRELFVNSINQTNK
ncbi:MAG: hypothetical protein RLZZ230_298, partial [Candidatus Parcubacteria bacterium]